MVDKWEYRVLNLNGTRNDEVILGRLGDEGWELVAVTTQSLTSNSVAYLKRKRD
ncbi:MAG: hypothetical protein QG670_1376 [Thermoproteota archaeon]|nr:hypothetical protein [Thermoproteota archaeon]